MDDNTSIQFRLRLAQINGIKMNEEQIHEAAITHVLPKKEVAGHIKRVEDAYNRVHGKDYKIVPLPAEHKLAKTHAGIVFKNRSDTHVSDHLNLWGRTNVEKLDRSIPVNLRKSGPVKTDEEVNGINMNEEQINEKDLPKSRHVQMGEPEPVKTNTKPSSKNNMNNPPVHNQPSHVNEVVKSSGLTPKKPAKEADRAKTLETYHTAMAKYSHLPPPTAHINALNDTIDKHGSENANQHVTRHFYAHMQKYLGEEHINEAYNPQGKITHFVPKDKLDNHKKEMGFQGFDVETKPLPKTHPDHETHIGIVSKTPTESSHHVGAGAKRFGAGFVMR